MAELMLRENGINPENYIGLPYQGGIRYYREDVLDDLPDDQWTQVMNNAVPYEGGGQMMMSEMHLAANHKRRFQRRQFKLDKKQAKRDAKAERQAQRQQARADRGLQRQQSREVRSADRQAAKTTRSQTRSENLDKLAPALVGGAAALKSAFAGDQTGGTISFGGGQGVQGEGQIGFGADKNFITADSIITGVPNYFILGAAGVGAYLLLKK